MARFIRQEVQSYYKSLWLDAKRTTLTMTNDNSDMEIADPNDFFVTRDEEDNLQPVAQKVPGVEQHLNIIPLTMGEVERYGLDEGVALTDEELAEIFSDHLADLERELSEDDVSDNMIGFGKDALLQTILRASGYDMQNAMNMEQFEMLADLDEGKFQRVMELAQSQQ